MWIDDQMIRRSLIGVAAVTFFCLILLTIWKPVWVTTPQDRRDWTKIFLFSFLFGLIAGKITFLVRIRQPINYNRYY